MLTIKVEGGTEKERDTLRCHVTNLLNDNQYKVKIKNFKLKHGVGMLEAFGIKKRLEKEDIIILHDGDESDFTGTLEEAREACSVER